MENSSAPTPQDSSASSKAEKPPMVQPICAGLADDIYKQETLVTKLMKEFESWDQWRKPFETTWNRIYKLYLSSGMEEPKTTTRAKIFIPIVFQVVEAAVPKIMNVVFGQDEMFDVVPTDAKDQPLADIIKLLLNYQLVQADFFIKFMDFAKQLLLYGTSYFKVYWKVKRSWVWERIPVREDVTIMGFKLGSQITGWEEQKSYKVVERGPAMDVLDILDVFPDPDAQMDQEGQAVWIRSWISYDEVLEASKGQFPVYTNVPAKDQLGNRSANFSISRQSRLAARGTSDPRVADSNKVELLERWGLYDLDGDGIKEESYIVILDGKYLIHADGNPFHHQKRPVIKSVLFPVVKEWFGIGLIEPVIPLIHELNTLRRQRLDNINLAINRMWSVNAYAEIDLATLISTPGGIVLRGENPGDIQVLESPNVTDQNYTEASIVQADIENTTAPKSIQGSPDSGRLGRTAKGAQMIIGQALEKFGTAVRLQEEMAIKKLLRRFHQLNLQFIDDDDVFAETGYYGGIFDQKVTPEMIRAEVKFDMKGISQLVGKEAKINQAISFMSIFGKVLSPDSISGIAKQVWSLMGFDPNAINLQAVQPMPPEPQGGGNGQPMQNGADAPQTTPGAPSMPGGM